MSLTYWHLRIYVWALISLYSLVIKCSKCAKNKVYLVSEFTPSLWFYLDILKGWEGTGELRWTVQGCCNKCKSGSLFASVLLCWVFIHIKDAGQCLSFTGIVFSTSTLKWDLNTIFLLWSQKPEKLESAPCLLRLGTPHESLAYSHTFVLIIFFTMLKDFL